MAIETQNKEDKAALPPGMVLGPDGKPCKACNAGASFKAWSQMQKGAMATPKKIIEQVKDLKECPADVERLGRHTWTFLHTTAAYYPNTPNEGQKSSMLSLLKSLPVLYPCSSCASELKEEMKRDPPEPAIADRGSLSLWMCRIHNEVNRRLSKEEFDCSKVDERWKDGPSDGRCD